MRWGGGTYGLLIVVENIIYLHKLVYFILMLQIISVYKDPKGENAIASNTVTVSSDTQRTATMSEVSVAAVKTISDENKTLREKILKVSNGTGTNGVSVGVDRWWEQEGGRGTDINFRRRNKDGEIKLVREINKYSYGVYMILVYCSPGMICFSQGFAH